MSDAVALFVALSVPMLLVVAGTLKLADPRPATGSLRRVSRALSRQPAGRLELAVRAIGILELAVATGSMATGRVLVVDSAAVVVLCTCFLWFTNLARRRGAACGCWGSLSDGPAAAAEVVSRAVLLAAAAVSFAARVADPHGPPLLISISVLSLGCAIGVAIAVGHDRLTLVFRTATIGVAVPDSAQRAVSRRVRRATLATVRGDARVNALVAEMPQARIEWRHARVTSAQRRRQERSNRLVAIPGTSANLRVVAGPSGVLIAIGESPEAIYTLADDGVRVARKTTADRTGVR